jgi:hypothetical protein
LHRQFFFDSLLLQVRARKLQYWADSLWFVFIVAKYFFLFYLESGRTFRLFADTFAKIDAHEPKTFFVHLLFFHMVIFFGFIDELLLVFLDPLSLELRFLLEKLHSLLMVSFGDLHLEQFVLDHVLIILLVILR